MTKKYILISLAILFFIYRWLYLIPSAGRQRAYLSYVLRHKYFVLVEALKLNVPPHIALLHDWSKFRPGEWRGYSTAFNGADGTKRYEEQFLIIPWNDHQKRNKHHWQYWMITWDRGETELLPMPDRYRQLFHHFKRQYPHFRVIRPARALAGVDAVPQGLIRAFIVAEQITGET